MRTLTAARGSISFECRGLDSVAADARIWLRLEVRDSGIGITPAALANLFQPFTQADASTTREYGGTGLGLVICKYLTELMGGVIRVESEVGVGTVFRVDLPFGAASTLSPAKTHQRLAVTQVTARVLVVEDNEINQEVIGKLLNWFGADVTVAENGLRAVEAVQQAAYDLIFMDCQMPVMDGFEATRRIRALEKTGALPRAIPIIALTANALAGDREACLAAGMDDYLSKPILKAQLTKALARHLPELGRVAATPPPGAGPQPGVQTLKPGEATATDAEAMPARQPAPDQPPLAAYDPAMLQDLPMLADGTQPEFADRILAIFKADAANSLREMTVAAKNGDLDALKRKVHSLKSASAQIGALAFAAEARRLETGFRAGALPAADGLERLAAEYQAFLTAEQQYRAGRSSVAPER